MVQLHETRYGQKLLEKDIPEIAKQLKRIADALEKQNQNKGTDPAPQNNKKD